MLDGLKRLFVRAPAAVSRWDSLAQWAAKQPAQFRPAPGDDGFAIDGRTSSVPWRMEWGPSQRSYVPGHELRLRAELSLPSSIQALVLDRELQVSMEKAVFEQYVEGVQTRIDDQTPPEMRWLVMFPKLSPQDLGPLHDRCVAVAQGRAWLVNWLSAGLSDALLAAPMPVGQPFVLMIARGRLTLRAALPEPTPQALGEWLALFTAAARSAPRETVPDSALPSTQPGLFSSSTPSVDDGPER